MGNILVLVPKKPYRSIPCTKCCTVVNGWPTKRKIVFHYQIFAKMQVSAKVDFFQSWKTEENVVWKCLGTLLKVCGNPMQKPLINFFDVKNGVGYIACTYSEIFNYGPSIILGDFPRGNVLDLQQCNAHWKKQTNISIFGIYPIFQKNCWKVKRSHKWLVGKWSVLVQPW